MSFLRIFFRSELDPDFSFPFLSFYHISFILFLVAMIALAYAFKRSNPSRKAIKNYQYILGILLLIDRLLMHGWFIATKTWHIEISLPLFTCRFAIYMLLIYLVTGNKSIRDISVNMALSGGAVSILYPGPYAYNFPHFTNFSFVSFHVLLVLLSLSIIWFEDYRFDWKTLKKVLIFTVIYMPAVQLLNIVLGGEANYSYLTEAPFLVDFFGTWNPVLYSVFVCGIYCLLFSIPTGIAYLISGHKKN